MEIRYEEQNITDNLLYRSASILCNHGRHIYGDYEEKSVNKILL